MKKNLLTDRICLILTLVLVCGVAAVNLFQPSRPTVSEMEKRKLAAMPAFSFEALRDGTYFSDIAAFISDTFIGRDKLVSVSKSLDSLRGLDYAVGGDDSFVLIGKTGEIIKEEAESGAEDPFGQLDQAIENLKNGEEKTPEFTETEPGNTGDPAIAPLTEADADRAEDPDYDKVLRLSKETLSLTPGSGAVVSVLQQNAGKTSWEVSDPMICSLTDNADGSVNVKALIPGICTLTCTNADNQKAVCAVTVSEISTGGSGADGAADFITDGMFILGDAVYTQGCYSQANWAVYSKCAAYYKQLFGDDVTVSLVVAPVSSMVVDNPDVLAKIADQRSYLVNMALGTDPSVRFVNVYDEMYPHRSEYLFFRSDHHWTARGAYYAYAAFAKLRGLTPTPLEDFDLKIQNPSYSGSMYQSTQDYRVKNFTDSIEAFYSRKKMTMTVTATNGSVSTYDNCILPSSVTYSAFIAGDNPYTVINVPENPQDRNILVLKDSFGNAFVPFLAENFGNIIVVDVRHYTGNIYEQLKDYGLSDIVFVNNIQAANTYAWAKMYLAAVGYTLY